MIFASIDYIENVSNCILDHLSYSGDLLLLVGVRSGTTSVLRPETAGPILTKFGI